MSVIQKTSPLNLMGKVAIVSSAGTSLGAQTCRTFLRHNALVVGLAEEPITEAKHRLFSALNTHFQSLQLDLNLNSDSKFTNDSNDECKGNDESRNSNSNSTVLQRITAHVRNRFWKDGFDVLITFGEEGEGVVRLRREVAEVMSKTNGGNGGVILNVLEEESVEQNADIMQLAEQNGKTGVRANVVLGDGFAAGEAEKRWTMLKAPDGAVEEVRECVERFRAITQENVDAERGKRGVADLLLFLSSTELGGHVNGAVVTVDGGWGPL